MTKLMQIQEAVETGKQVMGVGQNSDVTTIGVMAILCLICLGIAITLWRSKSKNEKEQKELNNNTLKALTTANLIITNLDTKVENGQKDIHDLKLLVSQAIGEIKSIK